MTYPTCKTCKHWEHWEAHQGHCQHPKMGCDNPDAMNASSYAEEATFYKAGQDFGCIHHEEKK